MNLVSPRRIERHPPVLQTGAQTTYAREALLIGTPRENRTPTKRFGNSCAATTPARQLIDGGRPWSRTRNVCHKGPGLQPGGAHAIAPRRPKVDGQGGWSRTSDLLVPSEARYQLRHTLNLLKHW